MVLAILFGLVLVLNIAVLFTSIVNNPGCALLVAHVVVVAVVVVVVVVVSEQCTVNRQTEFIDFASNSSIVIIPLLIRIIILWKHDHRSSGLLARIIDVHVESMQSTDNVVILRACDI